MSDIFFPIQGAPGIADKSAEPYQHQWLLLAGANRVDQAQYPALQQLELALRWGNLQLRAPGMMRLDIVLDVIEDESSLIEEHSLDGQSVRLVHEGELAAAWFSNVLAQPVVLYKRLDPEL